MKDLLDNLEYDVQYVSLGIWRETKPFVYDVTLVIKDGPNCVYKFETYEEAIEFIEDHTIKGLCTANYVEPEDEEDLI